MKTIFKYAIVVALSPLWLPALFMWVFLLANYFSGGGVGIVQGFKIACSPITPKS